MLHLYVGANGRLSVCLTSSSNRVHEIHIFRVPVLICKWEESVSSGQGNGLSQSREKRENVEFIQRTSDY